MNGPLDPDDPLGAWPAEEPPRGFADRVLAAAHEGEERAASPSRKRAGAVRAGSIAAVLVAAAAGVALWPAHRPRDRGESIAADRVQIPLGTRAAAVLEPGAHVTWDGDDVVQSAGDVFYRVEPGAPFRVHTAAGDVTALGTCFRVRVELASDAPEGSDMKPRDVKAAVVGAAMAALATVAVYEGKVAVSRAGQSTTLVAGQTGRADESGVHGAADQARVDLDGATPASADRPFEEANRNLAGTVKEYQSRLTANEEERKGLQARLAAAEGRLAAAAHDGAAGPAKSEWDLTPADWAEMAKTGTVKYRLPCADPAAWDLTPERLNKLGLAPGDAPTIRAAYAKSNDRVWAQIKPLCAEALGGSAEVAETLGRATCSQLIMEVAHRGGGDAAEGTSRQVAEIRAGLRPMPGPGDKVSPALRLLLVLTGENRAYEGDLAESLGPAEAHRLAITDGMCTESHVQSSRHE